MTALVLCLGNHLDTVLQIKTHKSNFILQLMMAILTSEMENNPSALSRAICGRL
jgi:hypothetical protein